MLELLFSALICVVEYSIFIMFLQHYLNDRWERSRKLFCFKFLGLLICSVTLTFINTFQNSLWNVLTVFTLTFILSCIFYQGKWLVKIFLAVVTCTLSLISEFITMVMGSAIFGENLTVIVTLPSVQVPMTIISKVLLFTLVRIIFLIKRGKKYTRIGKESLLLYTLPVVTVANIILMVQLEYYAPSEESHKVLMAFVCIGLILCNIAVFFIYDKNLKKYELENQLRQAQEMQRLQASYYMQLEKSLNESRKQMHDFKNHITTLEHLHQGKENTKAVSYMQELQQQMKEQMNLASFKVKNAADDLSFLSYMDTCTIFANALDNAVKACSEIKEGERKIELFLKRKKDMLNIVIKNTKQNQILESNNRFFTTKSNKEHHGFGIENIKMAVEKYHGLVSIEYTEDSFVLAVIIPIPV